MMRVADSRTTLERGLPYVCPMCVSFGSAHSCVRLQVRLQVCECCVAQSRWPECEINDGAHRVAHATMKRRRELPHSGEKGKEIGYVRLCTVRRLTQLVGRPELFGYSSKQ